MSSEPDGNSLALEFSSPAFEMCLSGAELVEVVQFTRGVPGDITVPIGLVVYQRRAAALNIGDFA